MYIKQTSFLSFILTQTHLSLQSDDLLRFGNSWVLDEDQCDPTIEMPDPCDEGTEPYRQATDLCFVLIDQNGLSIHIEHSQLDYNQIETSVMKYSRGF